MTPKWYHAFQIDHTGLSGQVCLVFIYMKGCRSFSSWHRSVLTFFISFLSHLDQIIFFIWTSCQFCRSWHPNNIMFSKQAIPAWRSGGSGIYLYRRVFGLSGYNTKVFLHYLLVFSVTQIRFFFFFRTSCQFFHSWHTSGIMLSKQAIPAWRSGRSGIYLYESIVELSDHDIKVFLYFLLVFSIT